MRITMKLAELNSGKLVRERERERERERAKQADKAKNKEWSFRSISSSS